jgi:hypothetical protein
MSLNLADYQKKAKKAVKAFWGNRDAAQIKQKLVQEQLYTTAAVIASPKTAVRTGMFSDVSDMSSLKNFVASFAGHIAAEAAR